MRGPCLPTRAMGTLMPGSLQPSPATSGWPMTRMGTRRSMRTTSNLSSWTVWRGEWPSHGWQTCCSACMPRRRSDLGC
ncbi:hypothetical protein IHE44_0010603 [Lamprotornis superbus]|uniref:Uncharacterized protein n=1 Tax=Lamprotornis superbus TaxID=245042 RepID=A0A835NHK0_9PASS|nr:hypothetical protein IHE44_0010603 [Lamprotornis superbus]